MTDQAEREVIAAGKQLPPIYRHLLPVAKFLVEERGHLPLDKPEKYGFVGGLDGMKCHLAHRITDEDWAAINERFDMPHNIGFFRGLIRDNDNWVDILGHDTIISGGGQIPIEEWEERQRARQGG